MRYWPTPDLSRKDWDELVEEMERPPADTPERRAFFKLVREMDDVIRRSKTFSPEGPGRR